MIRNILLAGIVAWAGACLEASPACVTFPSEDGVTCTADLYLALADPATPFIVLCHQAGYSRGEYREIAPRLNRLGFNCLALDARSGGAVRGVENATCTAAEAAGKPGYRYLDALPDLKAALKCARKTWARGKLIAWGSSYSASLALHLAASEPGLVDGVLAFSPGEYFPGQVGVAESAARIGALPVFITSGPTEGFQWRAIYEALPTPRKASYLPEAAARLHGSSVLWSDLGTSSAPIPNPLSEGYWAAVDAFLGQAFRPQ